MLDTASTHDYRSSMTLDLRGLGNFLRDARTRKELTLRDVEASTSVSNAYLSQLEGAKIKQPSPAILHKLCEYYGLSYSVALELAGYPVPKSSRTPVAARFAAKLGETTPDEENSLLEYLQFLRAKKR
jgi:transcriptional regulator with XRE-family HTH domain